MIFPHHEEDLKSSGLSDETIHKMGVESLDSSTLSREIFGECSDQTVKSDGYRIPYPGADLCRFKIDRQEGDNGAKYMSPIGDDWGLYIPEGFEDLSAEREMVVITEGEKKAAKCVQEGIPAVAIPGVWMWKHPDDEGEKVTPSTRMLDEIYAVCKNKHVVVVADSDAKANKKVKKAMSTLAGAISHQVFVKSCAYTEVPSSAEEKDGLDDYMVKNSVDDVEAHLENNLDGFHQPGIRLVIPYSKMQTSTGSQYLNYLIPYEIKAEPVMPSVLRQEWDSENSEVVTKPTNAPYIWLKRNLIVLKKSADGTYSTESSDSPSEVLSEAEGVTDDRRGIIARLRASDLSEKEGIGQFGISGSPAEFLKIARAQRNARMVSNVMVSDEKGWLNVDGNLHYLYGSSTITPEGCDEVLPNLTNDRSSVKSAGQKGSHEKWERAFMRLIQDNPFQAVTAGFTASAAGLDLVGDSEPGVLHLYGESSKGKTTTLQVASSLIGRATNPRDTSSWIKGWRTTDNGLEKPLADTNHAPLMLDEIHAAPARTDWQATAYMIANGRGKERMTKNAEARKTSTWCLQVLSTGEVSMSDKIRSSAKGQVPGGLAFRVMDLHAGTIDLIKLEDGKKWSEIAGYKVDTDAKLAEFLENTFSENYGSFWPMLIEWLREDRGDSYRQMYEKYRDLAAESLPEDCSTIARRRTKHVASAIAGLDAILTVLGYRYQKWADHCIDRALNWAIENLLTAGVESVTGTEADGIRETLQAEIMAQINRFYVAGKHTNPGFQGSLGWVDEKGTIFLPTKGGFNTICQNIGLDAERVKQALMKDGWKKSRARHPEAGRDSNPLTVLKCNGMFKGEDLVSRKDGKDDENIPF